jgi:hypothetical protein
MYSINCCYPILLVKDSLQNYISLTICFTAESVNFAK